MGPSRETGQYIPGCEEKALRQSVVGELVGLAGENEERLAIISKRLGDVRNRVIGEREQRLTPNEKLTATPKVSGGMGTLFEKSRTTSAVIDHLDMIVRDLESL
jgi:hypothetical protein